MGAMDCGDGAKDSGIGVVGFLESKAACTI